MGRGGRDEGEVDGTSSAASEVGTYAVEGTSGPGVFESCILYEQRLSFSFGREKLCCKAKHRNLEIANPNHTRAIIIKFSKTSLSRILSTIKDRLAQDFCHFPQFLCRPRRSYKVYTLFA